MEICFFNRHVAHGQTVYLGSIFYVALFVYMKLRNYRLKFSIFTLRLALFFGRGLSINNNNECFILACKGLILAHADITTAVTRLGVTH